MKKTTSLLAALVLAFAGVATSAHAQNATVKVSVPFDFTVSTSALSSGSYTLSRISQNTWTIRNDKTNKAIAAIATANGTNRDENAAELVFKHLGSNYFLSEVHCLGQTTAVPASKAERSIEREMARNGSQPESIYVLASAR